ncbi:hypothetical protein V5E97_09920 [Singulisphaera sp. Ch08]|uniref:Bacteriophage tail tape measure N-terminal domain-containing protein n=1 Tax=Singulisphaera sp. Ch08 TaxID=3120278 RepID=A0AAU7CP01_9BACT
MAGINLGGIYADLDIRTGNLDQGLAKARNALDAVNKEVKQLQQDFADGAITASELSNRMAALGTTAAELTTRMNAAYTATTTLSTGLEILNANANSMTQSSARMGQALMQLGYIADDVQYGFSGVVNNIGPLVYGLGATAGVAAAAQVAAVAVYQLYTHMDQFQELIGIGATKTEAEEMERLAKATSRTADEQERLNKYKEQEKKIQQMMGGQSKEEASTEKAVQDIYNEAGVGKLTGTLAAKMQAPMTPAQEAELGGARLRMLSIKKHAWLIPQSAEETGRKADAEFDAVSKKIEDARNKEAVERAQKLMVAAKRNDASGDQARRSIISKLSDPSDPLHSVALQLGDAGPEARAKAEKAAADAAARNEAAKAAEERRIEAEKERKRVQAKDEADRQRQVGRLGFLEEQHVLGQSSEEEETEMRRLQAKEKERKEKEKVRLQASDDADRQRQVGRLGFLEEQHVLGQSSEEEETELRRLQGQDEKRKGREAKQAERESLRIGKEAAPGDMKTIAEMLAMQEIGGAIAPGVARLRIAEELMRNGANAEQAGLASKEIDKDAKGDIQKGLTNRLLEQENKKSEVFDASTLAARIQSSVGGNDRKQELSYLESMKKSLEEMARAGVLNVRIEKR